MSCRGMLDACLSLIGDSSGSTVAKTEAVVFNHRSVLLTQPASYSFATHVVPQH